MRTRPHYLIVQKEGGTFTYTADQLLEGDLSSADVGISVIVRLSDLTCYENEKWVPIPQGVAHTADMGEDGKGLPEHVHPSYLQE